MILTALGTGTAAPEPDRVCSGYLLETGELRLLMDCGPGVVHRMARLGIEWRTITHLLVTHFHNDHIGDIPMLFFAWKYGMRPARSEPLTVIGPKGTKKLFEKMAGVFGDHLSEPPFEVRFDEVEDGDERRISDVARVTAGKTQHTQESVAYRLESGNRSVCYTGDTGMSDHVAKLAQGVNTLLIECSVPDEEAMETHLSPSQLAAMARVALPHRLLVTHVFPQLDRDRIPELVRLGGWPAKVEVAVDGERYEI
ncbi:MAG: MBL fold metallo-hydrolase [Gemmatimonadota bacterium]